MISPAKRTFLNNLPVLRLGATQDLLDREDALIELVCRIDSLRNRCASGEQSQSGETTCHGQPLIGAELAFPPGLKAALIGLGAEGAAAFQVDIYDLTRKAAISAELLKEEAEGEGLDREGNRLKEITSLRKASG
jgi:hypothetical protein